MKAASEAHDAALEAATHRLLAERDAQLLSHAEEMKRAEARRVESTIALEARLSAAEAGHVAAFKAERERYVARLTPWPEFPLLPAVVARVKSAAAAGALFSPWRV